MPPEQQAGTAAMLAALSSRAVPSGMGALAGTLLGIRNTGAVFVDLLQSDTVREHIIERFDLQRVYGKRYREDALKKLSRRTDIDEDRKSGVIRVIVTDTDRARAQQMARAYVEELDKLVATVNTSVARREREFIEQRLANVREELSRSQQELSQFSSKNSTLDIKEQTRAMVEAGAKLQGELIVAKSELQSLQQFYGDANVRVRAVRARVAELQRQLEKLGGNAEAEQGVPAGALYPPLRQLPALGVKWADLYRNVRVQETVFELLTQQYELARIEEAKAIPVVRVVDPPSWPEKKSFPPRLLIILLSSISSVVVTGTLLIARRQYSNMSLEDPRKLMGIYLWSGLKSDLQRIRIRR
ncbi:MAG TPA: GNVR domain-containing protein [Terriglobales bacterium]|nr:GNVR domain-containing protein [Terriglobales bacterium]